MPEIQRCNLCTVILQLKAAGIEDVSSFDFIDPPSSGAILRSLQQLLALGALRERDGMLTPLGKEMSGLPLNVSFAKLLIESFRFRCVDMALTLVAMLSVDSVLFYPKEKREEASNAHKRFAVHDSDHETLISVYEAYHDAKESKDWCEKHFVNARSMRLATRIRDQLEKMVQKKIEETKRMDKDENVEDNDDTEEERRVRLRKCLTASCFLCSARIQPAVSKGIRRVYRTMVTSQTVSIHPSSVLFRRAPVCIIYNELVLTARQYMRCLTAIPLEWLVEYAPKCFEATHRKI